MWKKTKAEFGWEYKEETLTLDCIGPCLEKKSYAPPIRITITISLAAVALMDLQSVRQQVGLLKAGQRSTRWRHLIVVVTFHLYL